MITNNNKRPSAITQRKNYTSRKQIKTMISHLIEDEKTDVDSDTEIE